MNLQGLYDRAPYPLQSILLNLYSARLHTQRYGAPFRELLEEFSQTEWFTPDQIRTYQERRLREMVGHAYSTVPFYRERMDALGLRPDDVSTIEGLSRLPILEKNDVRMHYDALRSRVVAEDDVAKGSTSGTTGSPLTVAWDRHSQLVNNVVDWRQKRWGGVEYGQRIAQILGRTIVAIGREKPPFWQYDYWHRQLWMSAFHLRADFMRHFVDKLNRYKPHAIEGYPSTVTELARHIRTTGAKAPSPKAVFTSSEPLLSDDRALVEDVFQAPVLDFYGTAERVLFATQCMERDGQHVNFEYGIIEVVDERGERCAEGQEGEIVATSLWNRAMPLLRYRIGDRTALSSDPCACGRHSMRMKCVETKFEDAVIRPDGTRISPSILTHPFKPISTIERSQVIQRTTTDIVIRIVRRPGYGPSDEEMLLAEFRRRVGESMTVGVEYVEEISRTRAGKYRWVINETFARSRETA